MEVLENNRQQKWDNTGGYGTDGENCYFYSHLSSGGLKTSTKNHLEPPVIIAFVVVGCAWLAFAQAKGKSAGMQNSGRSAGRGGKRILKFNLDNLRAGF